MNSKNNIALIAGSIVVAGLVIALGIFAAGNSTPQQPPTGEDGRPIVTTDIPEVTQDDHVLGSRDASVMLVEYADVQCSHCQRLHGNLSTFIENNDIAGENFAWVYRHLPIYAPAEAHAMECAANLGGNETFWEYLDIAYEQTQITPAGSNEDLADWAEEAGLNREAFLECQESQQLAEDVTADAEGAQAAGAGGTPFNVFIVEESLSDETLNTINTMVRSELPVNEEQTRIAVAGGLPYDLLSALITTLVQSQEGEAGADVEAGTSTEATE